MPKPRSKPNKKNPKKPRQKRAGKKVSFPLIKYLYIILLFLAVVLIVLLYKKYVEVTTVKVGRSVRGAKIKNVDVITSIDSQLTDYTNKNLFSGAVLIAQDDKILLRKGYGYGDRDQEYENGPDTRFRLGSLTKAFTSMGIMILYDRNFIDIKDKISKYIPEFKNGDKVTVEQLLTHKSGIKNYFAGYTKAEKPVTTKELVEIIKKEGFDFEPGSKFEYSNSNYALLTYIIEQVSKTSYENFLKENIFEPLDMNDTEYDRNNVSKKYAKGYVYQGKDEVDDAEFIDMTYASGTGGLVSTVNDMYKWDQALYTDKLVSKDVMKKIFRDGKPGYGYGWNIVDFSEGGDKAKLIWHEGLISGFTSYIYRYVDDKLTIIILRNMEPNELDPGDLVNKTIYGKKYVLGQNEWFLDFD